MFRISFPASDSLRALACAHTIGTARIELVPRRPTPHSSLLTPAVLTPCYLPFNDHTQTKVQLADLSREVNEYKKALGRSSRASRDVPDAVPATDATDKYGA